MAFEFSETDLYAHPVFGGEIMRHKLSLAVLIFIWLCSAHVRTSAQTKPKIENGRRAEKVDSYIREKMSARHIPGLSLAVVRNGKIIYAKGYGMANLELSVPASPETNYPIYSVTKIFTATAVMMLVEEGKLALEDPISKHLTGISPAGKSITVRQLLSHTSGIRNTPTDRM